MNDPIGSMNASSNTFDSIAEMRDAHGSLLKHYREVGELSELFEQIKEFIRRGQATGALLSDEDERSIAQTYLDHWVTAVEQAGYEGDEVLLAEFNSLTK